MDHARRRPDVAAGDQSHVVLDLATDRHMVYVVVANCAAGAWSCRELRLLTSPVSADAFRPAAIRFPSADHGAAARVSADLVAKFQEANA